MYYLVSTKTDNISQLSRFCGILRGQESFAQAVSFGLNTRNWYGGRVPLAVNTALLGLAIYPTYLVVRDHVPDVTDKFAAEESKGSERSSDIEGTDARRVSVRDVEKLATGAAH
jgi:hypothetical protein